MRVALVTDWYLPRLGGIESHLSELAQRLTGDGHLVEVITPTPGDTRVDGIRVHRIDAPRAPRFGFVYSPAALRAIRAVIAAGAYDVVHVHVSIVSPAALGGAAAAASRGLPTVVTFHSVVPAMRLLARATDAALGMSRWPVVFSAVSQRVARDVAPLAGAATVEILPNGIDTAFWRRGGACADRDPRRLELVSVMRLQSKKRPAALVRMMRRLSLTPTGDTVPHLRIAGDGPERASLERAIRRWGLDDRVELLGRLSRDQIRTLLSSSDVFVLPTVRESFGIAALEARCVGLPVIAMAGSGVAEHVEPNVHGFLAADDRELADLVMRLARDPSLRARIAAHNRATSPDVDWVTISRRHVALYERAAEQLRAPRRAG